MKRNWLVAICLLMLGGLLTTSLATTAAAHYPQDERGPMGTHDVIGVFAHLDIEVTLNGYSGPPNPTTEQLHTCVVFTRTCS